MCLISPLSLTSRCSAYFWQPRCRSRLGLYAPQYSGFGGGGLLGHDVWRILTLGPNLDPPVADPGILERAGVGVGGPGSPQMQVRRSRYQTEKPKNR